jgi:hypothetical protein
MSKFFTNLQEGIKKINESSAKNHLRVNANKFFNREGLASVMDANRVSERLSRYGDAVGDGSYTLTVKSSNGTALKNAYVNLHGQTYRTSSDGDLRFIDKQNLDLLLEDERKYKEHINKLVEYALTSRTALKTLSQLTDTEFNAFINKGAFKNNDFKTKYAELIKDCPLPAEAADETSDSCIDVMCDPELLTRMPQSFAKNKAVVKIAWLIEAINPCLDTSTDTRKAVQDALE